VSSLAAWAQESSARVGRGLGAGVWCRVVSVFGQFPLLTGHSLLLNEKAELLLVALKKKLYVGLFLIEKYATVHATFPSLLPVS
jgi:hypothetical protein